MNQHRTALFLPWRFWTLSPNLLLDQLDPPKLISLKREGSKINVTGWHLGEGNTQVNRWSVDKVFVKVASCTKSSVYLLTGMRKLVGKRKKGKSYNGKTMKINFSKLFFLLVLFFYVFVLHCIMAGWPFILILFPIFTIINSTWIS